MVAKQFLGQLSMFQQDSETISTYLERVQIFLNVDGIEEDKQKVPIFFNAIGADVCSTLQLAVSCKASHQEFCRVTESSNWSLWAEASSYRWERFYFHQQTQGSNESVLEYVTELWQLATHCEFGTFLQDTLCDWLVYELQNTTA